MGHGRSDEANIGGHTERRQVLFNKTFSKLKVKI